MKNTIEANKLIAEFMSVINDLSDIYYLPQFGEYKYKYGEFDFNEHFRSDELKYHSSWDWLMPVVEKIESLNFSTSIYHLPKTLYTTKIISGVADVVGVNRDTKIQSVFDAVIEFINWYNQNKTA